MSLDEEMKEHFKETMLPEGGEVATREEFMKELEGMKAGEETKVIGKLMVLRAPLLRRTNLVNMIGFIYFQMIFTRISQQSS